MRPALSSYQLFRQNQFSLSRAPKAIDLSIALDPNFFTAASQLIERNDLGQPIREIVVIWRIGWRDNWRIV